MAASNIRIKKICQWCGVEFEAQKVSTKYCSHRCANLAYIQAVRDKRVRQAENETHYVKTEKPVENIKDKEYLSIAQAATLLGLSLQAVYKMIYTGHLVAYTSSLKCLALFVQRHPNFSDSIGQMGLFLLGFTCRLPHTAIYRAFVRRYSNFSNCFGQMVA